MTNEAVQKAVSANFCGFLINCSIQLSRICDEIYSLVIHGVCYFLHRLLHWRVLIIAAPQMSAVDWMLNKRSSTFQSSQLPLLDPSLRLLNWGRCVVNTRLTSKLFLESIDWLVFFSMCLLLTILFVILSGSPRRSMLVQLKRKSAKLLNSKSNLISMSWYTGSLRSAFILT